jgi:hypothetical protein
VVEVAVANFDRYKVAGGIARAAFWGLDHGSCLYWLSEPLRRLDGDLSKRLMAVRIHGDLMSVALEE